MSPQTVAQNPELESSRLYSLARVAMATSVDGKPWIWPTLDFNDPAQRRFGEYELMAELGRGGMGVVYRARQPSLDREVALKFIAAGMADTLQVTRFLGEARAAARLVHPNIVPVFEVGSIGEVHYYSMPLIEGETLEARLQRQPPVGSEMLAILVKVCEAVDYAHRLGLLHLDLKPANILIDARGEPLVADFGLARHMDADGCVHAQEVSGTPAFMAPEQILIEQYRLTAATDIYALGALLYRCIAGVSPHGEGSAADLIRRALAGQIRRLRELSPSVDRDLAAVCEKCLALDQRDRYDSVRSLTADLRKVEAGLPVSVRRPGWIERARRWIRREPKLALAQAVAFVAISAGALTTAMLWQQSEAARRAEAEQRELTQLAAALGGRLYAHSLEAEPERPTHIPADKYDPRVARQGRERRAAHEVIGWLQQRLPDDPQRQGAVLGDFAQALADNDLRDELRLLLRNVITVLGAGYRQQVIAALETQGTPDALARAAILAWQEEKELAQPLRVKQLLDRAIAIDPDHVFTRFVAATFCTGPFEDQCAQSDAAEQLVRVLPDDGYAWLVMAARREGAAAYAALHEAVARDRLGSQFARVRSAYVDAMLESGVALPALVAEPARILAPNDPVEITVGRLEAWSQPLFHVARIAILCDPQASFSSMPDDAGVRADCIEIGSRLARDSGSMVWVSFGGNMVEKLAPGSPQHQAIEAQATRVRFLGEMLSGLTPAQRLEYPAVRFEQDAREVGDLEAMARKVAHFGLPTEPPAGWTPKPDGEPTASGS